MHAFTYILLAIAVSAQSTGSETLDTVFETTAEHQRQNAEPNDTNTQSVDADITFIAKDDGEAVFDPIFFNLGNASVRATIAGGETLATIDLSTPRNLVDSRFIHDRHVQIGPALDTITWLGNEYQRSRASNLEVVLDGQLKIISDVSAIPIDPHGSSARTAAHFVLGRGLLNFAALVIAYAPNGEALYGIVPSRTWVSESDTLPKSEFPYSEGVLTLQINGVPLRLFIDFNAAHDLSLTRSAFKQVWPDERPRKASITYGPFTRVIEPEILFNPPIENIDGSIGVSFIKGSTFIIDGPANIVHILAPAQIAATTD